MRRLLVSCFGLGWLPFAPGSWGSLPPVIIFALLCHFGVSSVSMAVTMAVLALVGSVVCIKFAPAIVAATGESDPREVVADEFAGQAITFIPIFIFPIGYLPRNIGAIAFIGFILFRIFDILKLWPIRKLEKLPKSWGILADDLLAGIYAGVALQICTRLCLQLWPDFIDGI